MRSWCSTAQALALVTVLASWAQAAVVQFDLTPHFNADVVVNNGSGTPDPTQDPIDLGVISSGNFCFPTARTASEFAGAGETPDGLPDDGFFAAGPFHPNVQLAYHNDDDGLNAWRLAEVLGSITVEIPDGIYTEIHVFATSGDGSSSVDLTLHYDDASSDTTPLLVPDWFNDPAGTAQEYALVDGLDRMQPGSGPGVMFDYEDSNTTAVFGFRLDPDPAKTLTSFTVERTGTSAVLNVFGAVGVALDGDAPTVYESVDPALVVDVSNAVGTASVNPYRHTPALDPVLYYQLDDGTGLPALIEIVKDVSTGQLLIYF
jgi:hypothetical protein